MKLFRVTAWYDGERKDNTFETFVVAKNKTEARKMVEAGIWTLSGMKIECVKEIDMSFQQILCSINTDELD